MSDFAKFDRPALLHLAFQALDRYQQQSDDRRLPRPYSSDDSQKFVEYAKEINNSAVVFEHTTSISILDQLCVSIALWLEVVQSTI